MNACKESFRQKKKIRREMVATGRIDGLRQVLKQIRL